MGDGSGGVGGAGEKSADKRQSLPSSGSSCERERIYRCTYFYHMLSTVHTYSSAILLSVKGSVFGKLKCNAYLYVQKFY